MIIGTFPQVTIFATRRGSQRIPSGWRLPDYWISPERLYSYACHHRVTGNTKIGPLEMPLMGAFS